MTKKLTALILTTALVAGCGGVRDSAWNPFNWFGGSSSRPVLEGENPLIPKRRGGLLSKRSGEEVYSGQLVGTVTELLIERRPGGAIIRATGVTDQQGPYGARLVRDESNGDPSVLAYDFRALQSAGAIGGTASRSVTVAEWLTDQELAGIRTIAVRGARNVRSSRR